MKLYVVRNKQGKFFKNKGFGGYGSNWKDNLEQAKFYPKIGQAKARVTYFAKNHPTYGVCDILEFSFDVAQAVVMNMEETTAKVIQKEKFEIERREIQWREQEMKRLQDEKDRLEAQIASRRSEFARFKQKQK